MKIKEAEAITHTLSKPGKMPGFAYSTPAHECKTGTKITSCEGQRMRELLRVRARPV